MANKTLKDLVSMSNITGSRVDYVQAGGGNTSAKLEDGYMAIKASGYLLKEMTEDTGFVVVNSDELTKYHTAANDSSKDLNKEAMNIAMASIKQINGEKAARPSVEAGFHSVLGKFVLHLHPVYTNVLMCSKGGVDIALNIAKKAGLAAVAVEYAMPGYDLVKLIIEAVKDYKKANSAIPNVIFLKNHGVITHADTARKAIVLMDILNDAIRVTLRLPGFPTCSVERRGNGYVSTNKWLKEILYTSNIAEQMINCPVYPDQLVYTANELTIGSGCSKIVLDGGDIIYNSGKKEAVALEETMTALAYLYYCIRSIGLELELLSSKDCSAVLGWDSEKYRKSLMSQK